jgi:hypothetical protein
MNPKSKLAIPKSINMNGKDRMDFTKERVPPMTLNQVLHELESRFVEGLRERNWEFGICPIHRTPLQAEMHEDIGLSSFTDSEEGMKYELVISCPHCMADEDIWWNQKTKRWERI